MTSKTNNSRSLINLIGIPVILSSIYFEAIFPFFVLVVLSVCTIEYVNLSNRLNSNISILILLSFNFLVFVNAINMFFNVSHIIILFFILSFINEMIFYSDTSTQNISSYIMGVVMIGCCLSQSLIAIRALDNGLYFTLLLFFSVWVCDTFAFIFGSKFGKSKILPAISPNKTWVGSLAGVLGAFSVTLIFFYLNIENKINFNISLLDLFVFSIITGVFGQIGDFSESIMKRQVNIKDTGTILMGHGGFLDRFDSITFAAPLYYIYILNYIQ